MAKIDSSSVKRWRTARRVTLTAIILGGTMATAAALAQRFVAHPPCSKAEATDVRSYYTYPGIGVELSQEGSDFVVRQVFPDTPADGKLFPGATLVSVDGDNPATMRAWTTHIRGEAGTGVELEVAYPCSGHDTVTLTREIIRVAY